MKKSEIPISQGFKIAKKYDKKIKTFYWVMDFFIKGLMKLVLRC